MTCIWLSRLLRETRLSVGIPSRTNTSRVHFRTRLRSNTTISVGSENINSVSSATTGVGTGKATFKELLIEKSVDTMSRSLFALNATGGHLAKMQLYLRKAGVAGGKPYLVYAFNMVFLSKIDWSASSDDEQPIERLTFAYGALGIGYYPQKPDGTFGTAVKTSWSQVTNTEAPPDILAGF